MLKRLLFEKLTKYLEHKNALIITGMRQVGKTTLLKQIFAEVAGPKIWFDFDNPLDQKMFEELDYNNIYHNLLKVAVAEPGERIYVFIDEIQNLPEITKVIKFLIDHYQVKFFLTGSSNFYLKNLFPESLSGRKFLFHLAPLSFREYLYFKDQISFKEIELSGKQALFAPQSFWPAEKFKIAYDDYLRFGGFPEIATTGDEETKKQVLNNIFRSFFEKDLKILADYKDIKELRDLIILLAPRVGSMIDVTKIASELGVSRPKLYSYLEFLQGTFFIKLLPKYSKSLDRSIAGGKKIYFSDTGLLQLVAPVNEGQLLENAVVNQLDSYGELSFYNYRNTKEIDLILDKKIALEVKLNGSDYDFQNLKKLSSSLGLKEAYVISKKFKEGPGFISPSLL